MNKAFWIVAFLVFLFCVPYASAQNHLQKVVMFSASPATHGALLDSLEKHGAFYFSYNSALINTSEKLREPLATGTVEGMLQTAFGDQLTWKIVGSHIVLQRSKAAKQRNAEFRIGGVITGPDGSEIDNVIVYDINQRKSVVNKGDGRYRMTIRSKQAECAISYSRPGYHDTLIVIKQLSDQQIDVVLRPVARSGGAEAIDSVQINPNTIESLEVPIQDVGIVNLLVPQQALFVSQYLNAFETRTFQVSFLPFVGSNFLSAGVIRNRFSFNVLAGYSAGTDGLEVGGLVNINKGSVNGVQVGGLTNVVGGQLNGVQVGGLANLNMRAARGVQVGGLLNLNNGDTEGFQLGGLSNFNIGGMAGIQVAGISNTTLGGFSGIQLAGLFNMSALKSKLEPVHIGQYDVDVQVAGLGNYSKNAKGLQLAGLVNFNKDTLRGIQLSVLYNHTKVLRGLQMGLINYVDSLDKGASFGLINVIGNGYHAVQLGVNDLFPVNVSIKSGGRYGYTYAKLSMGNYYGAGLGFGVTTNAKRRVSAYVEASLQPVFDGEQNRGYLGSLVQSQAAMHLRVWKTFGISTGPTFNLFFRDVRLDAALLKTQAPEAFVGEYSLIDVLSGGKQGWMGWHAGLSFQF